MKKRAPSPRAAAAPRNTASSLAEAARLHQAGDRAAAEKIYREILFQEPDNPDAHHLLGVIRCQEKRFAEALPYLERAVELVPGFAEARQNLGKALRQLKRHDEAATHMAEAVRLKPDSAEALADHGNTLRRQGKFQEAEAMLRRALALAPNHVPAWLGLAETLRDAKPEEALAAYRRAVELAPDNPAGWNNLGTLLKSRNDTAGARAALEQAVQVKPDFAEGWNNLANLLLDIGEKDAAVRHYREAIHLRPDFHEAHNNLGNALKDQGDTAAAVAAYLESARIRPDFAEAYSNMGNALLDANDYPGALAAYRKALDLKPDFLAALNNLAGAHVAFGAMDAAMAVFDAALAIDPDYAAARFGRALADLAQGNFARGWQDYETRWAGSNMADKTRPPRFSCPQWQGETETQGQRIIVYHEQGLGDTIQFVRYLPLVAERFGQTTFVCQPELVDLVRHSLGAGVRVIDSDEGTRVAAREPFDRHCPLLSLPLAFGSRLDTLPRARPYLMPVPERLALWQRRMPPRSERPRIGLVWAGNPDLKDDSRRSLTLAQLAPLFAVPGIEWHSLQKGPAQAALKGPGAPALIDWGEQLHDFADTAALLAHLDLLVCVDTSVAHLAGALGIPVWLLNRYDTDWRWLRSGTTSPWYPSMRLFRQRERKHWEEPIGCLAAALQDDLSAAA